MVRIRQLGRRFLPFGSSRGAVFLGFLRLGRRGSFAPVDGPCEPLLRRRRWVVGLCGRRLTISHNGEGFVGHFVE